MQQQQISLDQILSMLLARVDSLSFSEENLKTRFNILARAMYKKGLLDDADILDAVRDEHRLLLDLGALPEMPDDETLQAIADSILQWIKNDIAGLKKSMDDYEARMREAAAKEASKSKIEVAPANVLGQLDQLSGKKPGGGKLII